MLRADGLAELAAIHSDELVICNLGRTAAQWWRANSRRDEDTFYMRSSMGLVSSMGLGLALALPHRTIWALDGDGSIAMNLGSLLTIANLAPRNLILILWENRVYEVTGNEPLGMARDADFVAIARGAGIHEAHRISMLDDFRARIRELVSRPGPVFVVCRVAVDGAPPSPDPSPKSPLDMAYRFGHFVEITEQISVFGDELQPLE